MKEWFKNLFKRKKKAKLPLLDKMLANLGKRNGWGISGLKK
jgi:hypothetical protein